jgi:hypothetical protein
MKLSGFKYVVVICITFALFFKVSNIISYLSCPTNHIALLSTNDDATEKEEKKVETEYAVYHFVYQGEMDFSPQTSKKIIIPDLFFQLAYFPEVLTPPPSI